MHLTPLLNILIACSYVYKCTTYVAPIPSPAVEEGTLRPIPPNPCTPTPCGPNSQCQVVSGQAQCGCMANMIGSAPNCRPECIIGSDCPPNQACINQKCVDPCLGTCATNSECRVVNHSPICTCASGYTGNGFADCRPIPAVGKRFNVLHLVVDDFFITAMICVLLLNLL